MREIVVVSIKGRDYRGRPRSADDDPALQLGHPAVLADDRHGQRVGARRNRGKREAEPRSVGVRIIRMNLTHARVRLMDQRVNAFDAVHGYADVRDAGVVEGPTVSPGAGADSLVLPGSVDDPEGGV